MTCCRAALLLSLFVLPRVAQAQRPDTSATALARTPAFALTSLLDARPAAFVYRFDAPGWPEALSLAGLPPHLTTLNAGALPFDDLVTGRARFDLLPLAWLDSLGVEGAHVAAPLRTYAADRPTTEARYLSGPDGFQSIEAVHAQGRQRTLLGERGIVRYTFGYTGRAADNEYDNSRLTRGRATRVEVGFTGPRTRLAAYNLHTRAKVGAPDGVTPVVAGDPGSIYDRFNATVNDPAASRRTLRNDLGVHLGRGPLGVDLYRSAERFSYDSPLTDTSFTAHATRHGLRATLQAGRRALEVQAWTRATWNEADATTTRRSRFEAGVRDTLGGLATYAGAAYDGILRPVGAARWRLPFAEVGATLEMHTPPAIADGALGPYVRAHDPPSPLVATAHARVDVRVGAVRFAARPFASVVQQGHDFVERGRDTLVAVARDVRRAGLTLGVSWRGDAPRGLYADLSATGLADVSKAARDDHPALTVDTRFGLRTALFQRDLLLDLFARLQGWTAFDGRVLHDPTGLVVLSASPARVPASSTLDVTARMRVRVATLFLTYENILSGTVLLRGNLLVPEQPLPERRLRFGVFWPIFD